MLNISVFGLHEEELHDFVSRGESEPHIRRLEKALYAWGSLLGAGRVSYETRDLSKNTIDATRVIPAVIQLCTAEEISKALQIAQEFNIKVYPISTGNNWGYGAALPVTDENVIFDLRGMNRVLAFDRELGTVTVQPGVTQRMLYEYLQMYAPEFLVPVTGAGPDCSILGNALERGYGITPHTDHFAAVHHLKAVLPNGEFYDSHFSSAKGGVIDQLHKWGVGPYLDGIFTQSNLGIVTEITIDLKKKSESIEVFVFRVKHEKLLEKAVTAIHEILEEVGENLSGINLMNGHRIVSMTTDYPFEKLHEDFSNKEEVFAAIHKQYHITPWVGVGAIYGSKSVVKTVKKIIKRKLRDIDRIAIFMSRKRLNLIKKGQDFLPFLHTKMLDNALEKMESTLNVLEGIPQKVAIPLAYWKNRETPYRGHDVDHNPAKDHCGLIWFTPLIPLRASDVRAYTEVVKRVCRFNSIEPLMTMTTLSAKVCDSSVPILFDRSNEEDCRNAKQCYLDLYEACGKLGYLPYRMGVDHMHLITENGSTYWELVRKIKELIDPSGILSPGRYCPEKSNVYRNFC